MGKHHRAHQPHGGPEEPAGQAEHRPVAAERWVTEPLAPDPREVAHVLGLPLREILERGWTHAIPFQLDGHEQLSPVFEAGDRVIYVGTAHVLLELLEVCAPLFEVPPLRLEPGRYGWSDVLR